MRGITEPQQQGGPVAARDAPVRIIMFEPDPRHALALREALALMDCTVIAVGDPALSVRDWTQLAYDLAVINPFHSAGKPADVAALVRRLAGDRPVMVLTPQDDATMRTVAIANGADDAMAALGARPELATRIMALLRRRRMMQGLIACDDLRIDLFHRAVSRGARSISLPSREFDLLAALARTPDRIISRHALLRSVWRLDFDPGTNRVEVHMSRLRGRIDRGEHFPMLRTVKGAGYALVTRLGAAVIGDRIPTLSA